MYKITAITNNFHKELIPTGLDPRTRDPQLSYEITWQIDVKTSLIGSKYFFQNTIPDCDSKYWKNENGIVVEMTTAEKVIVDEKIIIEQKIISQSWDAEFTGKGLRITLPSELTDYGQDYFPLSHKLKVEDTDYIFDHDNSVIKVYPNNVKKSYCGGFSIVNDNIICADPRLTVEWLGTPSEDTTHIYSDGL